MTDPTVIKQKLWPTSANDPLLSLRYSRLMFDIQMQSLLHLKYIYVRALSRFFSVFTVKTRVFLEENSLELTATHLSADNHGQLWQVVVLSFPAALLY